MEIYKYKDFTIEVGPNHIKIDKDNSLGRVHATILYDRPLEKGTFSGQYPWVIRGGNIHKKFNSIILLIGTSTKVTKAKQPAVNKILDSIRK